MELCGEGCDPLDGKTRDGKFPGDLDGGKRAEEDAFVESQWSRLNGYILSRNRPSTFPALSRSPLFMLPECIASEPPKFRKLVYAAFCSRFFQLIFGLKST